MTMLAYSFNGTTLAYVEKCAAPLGQKVGAGTTPGRIGGYPGIARPSGIKITITGKLIVETSYSALEDAWAQLKSAHYCLTPAQLCIRDGWYIWALCETFAPTDDGIDHYSYQGTYAAGDPYQYNQTIETEDLGTTGATFTAGGYMPAAPAITINVTTSGGTVTIVNTTTGETFVLSPASPGSYIIDSRLETSLLAGADITAQTAGQYLSLAIGPNTLTVTCAGGAVVSDVSLTYNARSL